MISLKGQIAVKRLSGTVFISSLSEVKITLQDKTVTPTAAEQIVEADNGYDGLQTVTVVGDHNFDEKNIRAGVTMWGKMGKAAASPFSGTATGGIPYVYKGAARSAGIDCVGLFESSAAGAVV